MPLPDWLDRWLQRADDTLAYAPDDEEPLAEEGEA